MKLKTFEQIDDEVALQMYQCFYDHLLHFHDGADIRNVFDEAANRLLAQQRETFDQEKREYAMQEVDKHVGKITEMAYQVDNFNSVVDVHDIENLPIELT